MNLNGYRTELERQECEDAFRRRDADRVIRAIASEHGVSYDDVMSRRRGLAIVVSARHHAMAVLRWSTTWSLPEIARIFNRHNHTTVISAVRNWERVLNAQHGVKMVEAADSTPDVDAVPTHNVPALEAVA
jgi:chromosomal replication initiation ATPase DnaA